MRFYYFPTSCSTVSHVALEESGLVYESHRMNWDDAEEVAHLRSINPHAAVPTLEVNGRGLDENIAIVAYVASLAPDADVLPNDPLERAQAVAALAWGASLVHTNFRKAVRPGWFSGDEAAWPSIRQNGRDSFWKNLQEIEGRLASRQWLLGNRFSAADGYALRFYEWARIDNYPVEELRAYAAYIERLIERPAVARVLAREGWMPVGPVSLKPRRPLPSY